MKYAIYAALIKGGSIPQLRKYAIRTFKKTTNLRIKSRAEYDKGLAQISGPYTTEASLRRDAVELVERGYGSVVKGKGLDTYIRIIDRK